MLKRALLALLFLLMTLPLAAQQVILNEDFEDGDFTQNPEWVGDLDDWTIVNEDGNNILRLDGDNVNGGVSVLSTQSIANYGSWEFFVRLDGFATSDNNRAHVFLISDRADVREGVNGYAVRVGESGANKFFRIVRFTNGSATVLVTGSTLIQQNIGYQVRVERDTDGLWSLFVSEGYGSTPQPEGTPVVDNTHNTAAWFGLRATYTATRFDRFFFDDIIVTKEPLFLANVIVQNNQTIDVVFSEAFDPASIPGSQFVIDQGVGVPDQVQMTQPNTVRLSFTNPLPGGFYQLSVSGVRDPAGIEMDPATFDFNIVDVVQPGDVVINEFFYDNVDVTFGQYVELFNRTDDKLFNLRNWRIQDNTTTIRRLTTSDYILGPGEFVVLTGDEAGMIDQFGEQPYLEMSNFPSLNRVAPDQIKIFSGDELLVDSLRYEAAVWGGTGVALERRSAFAISHSPLNWAESTSPFLGTPGQPNTAEPDPNPVSVTGVAFQNATTLTVTFSDEMDTESAEDASNYSMSGGISVTSASRTGTQTVELQLNPPMESGQEYTLGVSGVKSFFGVPMPLEETTFFFFETEAAEPGDVVINEFFYSVPPEFAQYVELFNNTEKYINLKDWRIQDNTSTIRRLTTSDYILKPGAYVVLTRDSTGIRDRFGSMPFLQISNFPSLNLASADQIKIFSGNEVRIDSLQYTPSTWGGSGVALERRSPDAISHSRLNWAESTDPLGGTPGAPNTAGPDPEPVLVQAVSPAAAQVVRVVFEREVDAASATDIANYGLSGGISIQNASRTTVNTIDLFLAQAMVSGTEYTLTISGVESIFGVPSPEQSFQFTYLEFEDVEFGDIVVNEFLYRPVTGQVPRFIELYNRSDKNIDLQSWQLGRSTAVIQLSSPGGSIPLMPDGYLVISDAPEQLGVPEANSLTVTNMLALSQNGDAVFLRTNNGTLVDSLRYSPSWGGSPAGFSLERIDPDAASNDPSNWRTHPENHSAGVANANFSPDTEPPATIFAKPVEGNVYEVRFNEFVAPDGNTRFRIQGNDMQVVEFNSFTANTILLEGNAGRLMDVADEDIVISIENLRDVVGNQAGELHIPVARTMMPADLIINEIMYQPISGRYNDFPDQSEYIEIFNRRNHAINLEGFYIHDKPDKDGQVAAIFPVSTQSAWIPGGGYAVMHGDPDPVFGNTRLARFFALESDVRIFRADRSTLSLSTQGDTIHLADANGVTIDSVYYEPGWHNPNLIDVRGIALERINPFGPSNDPENWGSSVVEKGGTPMGPNSLFATPETFPDQDDIVLEPNPFSPDGDGVDDNLFINYKLNHPDYLLRVRIFDRYGRLVRTLADGKPAGLEGTLIWDGRRDNGMENRIGIYVVYFEAFNSAAGRNRTIKKTVVLARQL